MDEYARSFRLEQERKLGNVDRNLSRSFQAATMGGTSTSASFYQPTPGSDNSLPLKRLLEVDVIISPVSPTSSSSSSSSSQSSSNPSSSNPTKETLPWASWAHWPRALVSIFTEKTTDIGVMESHGSLWKLVEKDDLAGGVIKVALQTSEIGESGYYLAQNLSLVTNFDKAAMWEVVILDAAPSNHPTTGLPASGTGTGAVTWGVGNVSGSDIGGGVGGVGSGAAGKSGLRVQFKLIEVDGGALDPRFLVCAVKSNGQRILAVLSEEQMGQRNDCTWNVTWDVMPEIQDSGSMDPQLKSFLQD